MPDFHDLVMHEIPRRGVTGDKLANSGEKVELGYEERFEEIWVIVASTKGMRGQ